MPKENTVGSLPNVEREAIGENAAVVASNIERFLNNHTREGGRMRSNMVARPVKSHPSPGGRLS